MAIPVARLVLREPTSLGALRLRDHVQELRVFGNPDAFEGPVGVLVDEGSASTTEIFAAGLRRLGRAVSLGVETSAGMALPSVIERLPDGGAVQIAVGVYETPGAGPPPEGQGVPLDERLELGDADFETQDDPVLAAAAAALASRPVAPAVAVDPAAAARSPSP